MTQPAVSRRIKFLEDQYGCALLDRSGSTLRPTEAGRLVYEKARTLLEIEADLVSGLHRLDGKVRISLSCTPSFGIAHLPAVLHEFMLACGESADLKFIFNTPEQILRGLTDGLYDVAVMEMCERFDLSAFATFALPGDEMVFASAPSLRIPETVASLDSLLDIPLFTRREGCCSRMMLEKNLSCIGHQLHEFRKVIVFDDIHVIVKAVLEGGGLAFLSRDVLADDLAAGRLQAHYVPGFVHARERALIIGETTVFSRPLRQFVDALFQRFSLSAPRSLADFTMPATAPAPAAVTGARTKRPRQSSPAPTSAQRTRGATRPAAARPAPRRPAPPRPAQRAKTTSAADRRGHR